MPEDKRIVKTRALLRSTLQDLVAERSFETITVKQLCEKADISRVTFYSHFPDKYALLNNLYSDFLSKVLQRCIDKTRLSGAKDDVRAYSVNLYVSYAEESFAPGRLAFFRAIFDENGYALRAFNHFIAKGAEDLIKKITDAYKTDLTNEQLASVLMYGPIDFLKETAFGEGATAEKTAALCRDYYSFVTDFVFKPHTV